MKSKPLAKEEAEKPVLGEVHEDQEHLGSGGEVLEGDPEEVPERKWILALIAAVVVGAAVAVAAEALLLEEEATVLIAMMAGVEEVVQESIAGQEVLEQEGFASGQVRVAEVVVQRQKQVPPRRG